MDAETQQEIAVALRQAVGTGQAMVMISGVGQIPLEVTSVERGVVRLSGQVGVVREVMGQQIQTTVPVTFTVALEAILGVGVMVNTEGNGNGGAPHGLLRP